MIADLAEGNPDTGNLRETFLLSQLRGKGAAVTYPKAGDFRIASNGRTYILEVGGKNKTSKQIAGAENAFLVLDGIEYGQGHRIPLWLFGFLY